MKLTLSMDGSEEEEGRQQHHGCPKLSTGRWGGCRQRPPLPGERHLNHGRDAGGRDAGGQ